MAVSASGGKCQVLTLGMLPKQVRTDSFINTFFSCDKDGSGVLETVNLNNENEFDKLPQTVRDAVLPYAISGEVSVSGRITGPVPLRNNVFNTTVFDENGNVHSSVTLNSYNFEYKEGGSSSNPENYATYNKKQFARLVDRRDSARIEADKQEKEKLRKMYQEYIGNISPSNH